MNEWERAEMWRAKANDLAEKLAVVEKERDEWKAEAYRLADVLPDGQP